MKHYYKFLNRFFGCIFLFFLPQISFSNETTNPLPPAPIVSNPSNCNLGLLIPDQSCFTGGFDVEIDVDNLSGTSLGNDILLKEIHLIIAHEWLADLEIYLTSPNGVSVELTSDNGSSENNYGNPTNGLCDEYTSFISNGFAGCSAVSIEDGTAPFIGEFLPEGDFAAFHDGSDPDAGNWILQLCDDGEVHEGTLEFVELVFVSASCAAPTGVIVNSVDSTTAEIGWTSGNFGTDAIIEYGISGFSVGTGTAVTATSNPFTINSLNPQMTYDFYIYEECGIGNISANSCIASFETTCSPAPITLMENFDDEGFCFAFCGFPCQLNGGWKNVQGDNFDWTVDNNSTPSSFTGPPSDISGAGKYLYLEATGSGCQNGNSAILVSELMEVNASGGGCDMSFNYHARGSHIGTLSLEITDDCGDNWQSLFFISGEQGNQWNFEFVDLSAYNGQIVQFRFIGTGGNGYAGDIAIDEITFYGSTLATTGINVYYFDEDEDGFGDDNVTVFSCDGNLPLGYVAVGGDCDDTDFDINPDAAEFPCDGVDNNCNGIFDDFFLFTPETENEEICVGQTPVLKAFPQSPNGTIEWFEDESDIFPVATGTNFTPPGSETVVVPTPTTFTFWVREREGFLCASDKVPVTLTIYPNPSLQVQEIEPLCSGTSINLLDYVIDENNTNSTKICFNQNNTQLPNCQVFPSAANNIYKVVFTAEGDCQQEVTFDIDILPSPIAEISGETSVCRGNSEFVTVSDIGNGVTPLTYQWNNGSSSNFTQVFSNQNAGEIDNYSVTITANNGCSSVDQLNVETIETISNVSFGVNHVTVCNGQNGSIELTINGGSFPYNVQWAGEQTGFFKTYANDTIINNLKQGFYQIQITDNDGNGCATTLPQLVVNGPAATIDNTQITPPTCPEAEDGCIEIEVSGNNPIIVWSTGDQTEMVCDLAAGNYSVTVFDGSCTNELAFTIAPPSEIAASFNTENVSCFNGDDGEIELFASGGTGNLSYNWSNNSTNKNQQNLEAGDYQVTITDGNNCSQIFETNISEPAQVGMLDKTVLDVKCHGDETGFISIKPNGGISPYQILWSNGNSGFQIHDLEIGTYFATIIDANGCQLIDTTIITDEPPLQITQNFNHPSCAGVDDGSIDISILGGVSPYQYSWNNAETTQDLIGNLAPGNYWVDVLDANGCPITSDTITLIGKEILTFEATPMNPTCEGVDNGTIDLMFHDSIQIADLSFEWSNNSMTQNISNLPQGEYFVTITDENNCQVDSNFILETTIPISTSTSVVNSSCANQENGSVTVGVSGDNAPFTIHWETGETDFSLMDLAAGYYPHTITDNIGCEFVDTIEIVESIEITITEELVEHILCPGEPMGSIEIGVTGGAGNYSYQWSNGANTQDINEILAGDYFVTVTDANNCVKVSKKFVVTEPEAINITTSFIGQPSCEGGEIENICIFATGGTGGYNYEWNNGNTTSCIENPPTGEYSVTVTDGMGCTEVLTDIKIPDAVEPLAFVYPNGPSIETICAGEGSVPFPVKIEGGTRPYQFLWSHGNGGMVESDTLWISGLEPGICNVTITDNFGCVLVSDTIEVINVTPVSANFESENVRCNGGGDGSIEIFATGGTPDYHYYWYDENDDLIFIDSVGTGAIDNLNEGSFSVNIVDDNGCQANINDIEIFEPATPLSMIPIEITNPQCFGDESGQISLTPSGGIGPYEFDWDSGDTTQNLIDIEAGIYKVTMTDANMCPFIQAFVVQGPDTSIYISEIITEDILCAGDETGSINLMVEGGWGNYNYFWTPAVSTEEDLENLAAGDYSLVIFDEMGCSTSNTQFSITEPDSIFVDIQKENTDPGQSNGFINLTPSGGTGDFTFLWDTGDTTPNLEGLNVGLYGVTITDETGCTTELFIQIKTTTGITNPEYLNHFSVFPNPANEFISLEIELKNKLDLEIEIYDIVGRKHTQIFSPNFDKGVIQVDVSKILTGTYFVILKSEGELVEEERLIIMK